jgi:hypothetical protein
LKIHISEKERQMEQAWENIVIEFRAMFGKELDHGNADRFLGNLRRFWNAAHADVPFEGAKRLDPIPYCLALSAVLKNEIVALNTVSASSGDHSPQFWKDAVHKNVLNEQHPLQDVLVSHFSAEIFNEFSFPSGMSSMRRRADRTWYQAFSAAANRLMGETLKEAFDHFHPLQRRAAHAVLMAHLWASADADVNGLSKLEALIAYAIKAPPIGRPMIEPNTMLVLTF